MRAFSPSLFSHGCPPGPYCLQKLLHFRFSGAARDEQAKGQAGNFQKQSISTRPASTAQDAPQNKPEIDKNTRKSNITEDQRLYGTEKAVEEYKRLESEWEEKKKYNALAV